MNLERSVAVRWGQAVMVSALLVLLTGPFGGSSASASFPGTNGKIAFTVIISTAEGNEQLATVNPDGSSLAWLFSLPPKSSKSGWSADGSLITYSRLAQPGVPPAGQRIYVANADGSNPHPISTGLTDTDPGQDFMSAFSADGSKIVFASNRDQTGDGAPDDYEIYMVGGDGAGLTQLTDNDVDDEYPDWSPNGSQVAFSGPRDGDDDIIVKDPSVMGHGNNITASSPTNDNQPSWSPDGTKIAFTTDRDGDSEIYTMNADGSGATNITQDHASHDSQAAWSPDGTKIAFASYRDGPNDTYVINADGSGEPALVATDLALQALDDGWPDWQPVPDVAPTITRLRVNKKKIKMRTVRRDPGNAVYFKFTLSEEAIVKVKLFRQKPHDGRYIPVGSFTDKKAKEGRNKAVVPEGLATKLEHYGGYMASMRAMDPEHNRSEKKSVTFQVVRG